ncbi:hypothetical protein C815_01558 [Firmicutes bacterium M10-2]|nr:hypothetical protein C815_01558 [Firmicutes bacterium M10-2]
MRREWKNDNITEALEIVTSSDFKQEHPELFQRTLVGKSISDVHFCKANHYKNITSGSFVVPGKKDPSKERIIFAFCIADHTLYFIDDFNKIEMMLAEMQKEFEYALTTPMVFLLDFMQYMITDDVYYLQKYEQRLSQLEEQLKHGIATNLDQHIMNMRKDLNSLGMYYEQLSDLGETLEQVVLQEKDELANNLLSLYNTRVGQLYSMVLTIKDYASQLSNLSQNIMSAKQNNIMQFLTGVTTIFLPLTLVTGWFGMNFRYLPFIYTREGFIGTCCFCVIVLVLEIIVFRKKNLFK